MDRTLRVPATFLGSRGCGQADDQPFENQPGRHLAIALQVEIGLQQPVVELFAALTTETAELTLDLLEHKRFDACLLQGGTDADAATGGLGLEY